jgi:glucokinase
VAIDIGGTKIDVAAVAASGEILRRERMATVGHEDLFAAVVTLARRLDFPDAQVIGVGCGGPMSMRTRTVSPLNIRQWRDFPLTSELAAAFSLPVFVDNDAKALALAEGTFGLAQGLDDFLSMVVSTGVGGGIVLDGRLLDGRDGNAGHIGHVVVVPDGRLCACGAHGCLEAEIAGPSIAAITGAPAEQADLDQRRRAGALLGLAVGTVASLLDLGNCFVAGSVALGFGAPFFDAANESAHRVARIAHARDVTIQPSGLGGDGPLLGAAVVGWRGAQGE